MKKIFTLLAAATMAASAMAIVPNRVPDQSLSPAPGTMRHYTLDELKSSNFEKIEVPEGMLRIKDKNTNEEWASVLANLGAWELENDKGPVPFEYAPYYRVIVTFQSRTNEAFFQCYLMWPAYGALDCVNEETGILDMDAAKELYGDKAGKSMSWEDYIKFCDEKNYDPTIYALPGIYPTISIVGDEAFGQKNEEDRYTLPNGRKGYMQSAVIADGKINYTGATSLNWTAFDEAASEYSMEFSTTLNTGLNRSGTVVGSFEGDFSGGGVVLGFSDIHWDTVGEVHIFNGGRQESGDDWAMNYSVFPDHALNYYFISFCDATSGYNAINQAGEEICAYSDTELPDAMGTVGSSYNFQTTTHYVWFSGALWAPENSQFPYGTWTMPEFTDDQFVEKDGHSYLQQSPKPYELICGYYYSYPGPQDGFHGMYEGYSMTGMPGKVQIGIGDKTYGFNFRFSTTMTGDYYIWGNSTADIFFHNTPNKWMEVEMLPAVGNEDHNVLGVKDVVTEESNAPVVSRSFYNFQGQRLNSEPESGMYIIRSVKADGTVKATKVAK
ncbi:MAG: hypothetical protein NC402_05010 [Prevotella sp.]|nr:hypothetical protein [Prevotella sp.]MCM1074140.1 hypothetical protein [Ruminococcus sp.]